MPFVPENVAKLRENYLVVELWRRGPMGVSGAPNRDRLYGLCRLPLHPFFISFRDSVIADSLLQAEVSLNYKNIGNNSNFFGLCSTR